MKPFVNSIRLQRSFSNPKRGDRYLKFWSYFLENCKNLNIRTFRTNAWTRCYLSIWTGIPRVTGIFYFERDKLVASFALKVKEARCDSRAVAKDNLKQLMYIFDTFNSNRDQIKELFAPLAIDWSHWSLQNGRPKILMEIGGGNIFDEDSWVILSSEMAKVTVTNFGLALNLSSSFSSAVHKKCENLNMFDHFAGRGEDVIEN